MNPHIHGQLSQWQLCWSFREEWLGNTRGLVRPLVQVSQNLTGPHLAQAESLNRMGLLGENGEQCDKFTPVYTLLECSGEYAFFEITAASTSTASSALQNTDFCSATYPVIYPTTFLDSNNLLMPLSASRPPSPPFFILKPKLFLEPRSPANATQPFLAASRQKHLPNSHPPEPLESMFMMHLVENPGPMYLHRVFLEGTHHVRFITLAQKYLFPCLRELRWTRVKKIFAEWVYAQILDNYKLNPSQIKLSFKG